MGHFDKLPKEPRESLSRVYELLAKQRGSQLSNNCSHNSFGLRLSVNSCAPNRLITSSLTHETFISKTIFEFISL